MEYATNWETSGTISGWIAWSKARELTILEFLNLCEMLCGAGIACAENHEDQNPACTNPPVEIPGTSQVGWKLEVSFGGGAVSIVE